MRQKLEAMGYAVFEDPGRAVNAIRALVRFREAFEAAPPEPPLPEHAGAGAVQRGASYDESQAKQLLDAAGIPCAREEVASSAPVRGAEAAPGASASRW